MPFVKLDCNILNSSLWIDHDAREVFVTALLMARPVLLEQPTEGIAVKKIEPLGFTVPPGEYGFVAAASTGIIHQAGLPRERGIEALARLAEQDGDSRTPDHEGRRLVRVDGGFIVLNYMKYRNLDRTNAERQARFRQKKRVETNGKVTAVTPLQPLLVTQAEAEADIGGKPPKTPVSSKAVALDSPPRQSRGGMSEDQKAVLRALAVRIGNIMHRRTIPERWSEKEKSSFRKLCKPSPPPEEDVAAVEKRYASEWPPREGNTLRRDLLTLLNNFSGEVDRAHAWETAEGMDAAPASRSPKPGESF